MLATRDEWADAPEFHVWVDTSARPPCVAVSGEIDLLTCAAFREALDEAVAQGTSSIAVDFRRTTFIGSTGIRELVRVLNTVEHVEARSPNPIVRRALMAAGLSDAFSLAD
jgi:anti-anti-sigma factor